jgi:hypothetical protein
MASIAHYVKHGLTEGEEVTTTPTRCRQCGGASEIDRQSVISEPVLPTYSRRSATPDSYTRRTRLTAVVLCTPCEWCAETAR